MALDYAADSDRRSARSSKARRALLALVVVPSLALTMMACSGKSTAPTTTAPENARTTTTSLVEYASDQPSKSAQMICGPDLRLVIEKTLALPELPSPTSTWSNHLYTCNYQLATGPLVLMVKEQPDVDTAKQYFVGLQRTIGAAQSIDGLASLGLQGFKTTDGVVIFVKDNMTLQIDARGLPEPIGPNQVSRSDFAYQIATNVLACWSGD